MKLKWIFLLLLPILFSQCNNSEDKTARELLWAEEFNYSGTMDSELWSFEKGYIRNEELQKYTSKQKNIRIENGLCIIECRMEDDSTITSASVNTLGKKEILYGRVEVRAKIPSVLGSWPAIWMLGTDIKEVGWPDCGEIDIMEHVGYQPDTIHGTVHTKAYNHNIGSQKGEKICVVAPYNDFHVYAIDWSAEKIDFFFDDSLYFTYENDGMQDLDTWPFSKPHYLLMNVAFGGSWGGYKGVDLDGLPIRMEIDYVRCYK